MMAKIANLKSLAHDLDYYVKAFQAFSKSSGKLRARRQWVEREFPELVVKELSKSFPADSTIQMLGVGSGSGEMDSQMAAFIKSHFKAVNNIVLEPSTKLRDMYRELITSQRANGGFVGIEFDLRAETMDGYRAKLNEAGGEHRKYHFISAIHSLYYVDDLADTVRYLYDQLEEGGILIAACGTETGGFLRLWERYHGSTNFFYSRHFRDAFSALPIDYETRYVTGRLDITNCFDPDSEEGRLLVDFLVHTVDLRGAAPPEVYQEVIDILRSESYSERTGDGTVLLFGDMDIFISKKPLKSAK